MMKNIKILSALLLSLFLSNCVQKTSNRTVTFTLTLNGVKNIKAVGIRGKDKPLSWDWDYDLAPVYKDSIYKGTVTYNTGYKFTEVKFVADGEFELKNDPNRSVNFSDNDTTFYYATFNKIQK